LSEAIGFSYTAKVIYTDGTFSSVYGIHDQDYIHNTKKMLGMADNESRNLLVGEAGQVHLRILEPVRQQLTIFGVLKEGDLDRKGYGAMDWASGVRILHPDVIDELQKFVDNGAPYRGMLEFIRMLRGYVGIYMSTAIPL
jgi:hypothetical protein